MGTPLGTLIPMGEFMAHYPMVSPIRNSLIYMYIIWAFLGSLSMGPVGCRWEGPTLLNKVEQQ